jgi:hypothetical protein
MIIDYINDTKGRVKAVQIPIRQWDKIALQLKKYEQTLKIKNDLTEAFAEVEQMRTGKVKKQTLSSFLNEL